MRRRSAAAGRVRRPLEPYPRLFWRIFVANAAVLALACAAVAVLLAPELALEEVPIFAAAVAIMVAVNLVVTRRLVAPLDELVSLMRRVDLLAPGERVTVRGRPSEATELAETFNEMLDRLEDERADSARRALEAQEAERLRVAQELHDEIGQNLTAALLQLGRIGKLAPDDLRAEISEAAETVRENLDDLRRIAQRLRPPELDELGLVSALAHFSDRLGKRAGIDIERRFDRELPVLGHEEELVIYRVAQEALTNVVRHAGASRAELALERAPDRLVLRVRDDGCGVGDPPARSGGIRGMRERAALVRAQLSIAPGPDGGTEVVLNVPVSEDGLWYR
jgi:two-component system, NarL family, sensor histidine kinase UhpB